MLQTFRRGLNPGEADITVSISIAHVHRGRRDHKNILGIIMNL